MTSGNSRRQKGSLAYVTHQAQIQIQNTNYPYDRCGKRKLINKNKIIDLKTRQIARFACYYLDPVGLENEG